MPDYQIDEAEMARETELLAASDLGPRPQPAGYVGWCGMCRWAIAHDAPACMFHATAAEAAWIARVEAITGNEYLWGGPRFVAITSEPTLF